MAGSAPGGYVVHHGLFRMPDLLNYEQMQAYFRDVYGYHLELFPFDKDGNPDYDREGSKVSPARAMGQSFNIAPSIMLDERDLTEDDAQSLLSGTDPVLREINEATLPSAYNTKPIGNAPDEDDERPAAVEARELAAGPVVDEDDDGDVAEEEEDGNTVVVEDRYDSMTNPELVDELSKRNLSTTGNKAQLQARLRESDANQD